MRVLLTCVLVHHSVLEEEDEGIGSPETGLIQGCDPPCAGNRIWVL